MAANSYLTQVEAETLIDMIKRFPQDSDYARGVPLQIPCVKGKIELEVVGETRCDRFALNIDRKGIAAKRCTFQGRTMNHNIVLIRIDMTTTGRHYNPNGDLIEGPHIHIYKEGYGDLFAIPYQPEDPSFTQICCDFFDRFNLMNPPLITYQTNLLEGEMSPYETTGDD